MLDTIANKQNDNNLDVFIKAVIYTADHVNKFDRFTTLEDLETYLTNINENANVLTLDLFPDDVSINHVPTIKKTSKLFSTKINFKVTPQTETIQSVLKKYNNKEVFIVLQKNETQHLYGNSKQPLLLTYSELHNTSHGKIKGYTVSISGKTTEEVRYINIGDFNIIERLLSSPLSAGL